MKYVAIFLLLLIAFYAVWLRGWLKQQPWAQGFFNWIEPIEIALYKKSTTILLARVKQVTGVLLTVLTQTGAIDITSLMPLVPEAWDAIVKVAFNLLPLIITFVGFMDEKLRNDTTQPLALVAVATKDITPAVAAAVATAETAKVNAVAVVQGVTPPAKV